MGRLHHIALSALALGALVAAAVTGGAPDRAEAAKGQKRPNVIVLMSDDQTAASQAVMKHTNALLGDRGATFDNSFTNWPLCCPSRATFLTGQYAHNHGVLGNLPPFGGFGRLDLARTLPVWLQRSGYYTAEIGKYLNGYEQSPVGVPPGWSEWHGTKRTYVYYGEQLLENGQVHTYGTARENPYNPAHPETYSTDVFTDKAVQVINDRAPSKRPFFLYVAYLAPHSGGPNTPAGEPPGRCQSTAKPAKRHLGAFASEPLPTPPDFNEADVSDKPAATSNRGRLSAADIANVTRLYRCRLESLLAIDDGVKRVVEALKDQGELDNTVVLYTSDNGFMAGEHRIATGKSRPYEESIRVPLLVRGPGIGEGVKVDDLVTNADLAPTIVDAAGAKAGLPEDGESLLPFARHPERRHGRELLIEQYGDAPDEEGLPGIAYTGIRTSRYKYVEYGSGGIELYDLSADPYELNNLHADPAHAALEATLASRLAALRTCAGPSCRTKPSLKLKLPREVRRSGPDCRRPRHFVAKVRGADADSVSLVSFRVGSKLAGRDSDTPLRHSIKAKLLRRKRRPQVRAVADLVDGRELSVQRRVRICR